MSKTVLVAPLNWGLGHAARCVPIIQALLVNHQVVLASDGVALELLKLEFPDLPVEVLPSYGITYPENGSFVSHIAKQIPGILKAIQSEKTLLSKLVEKHNVDVVISDNRYGMHHHSVKSIFITHQIIISAPFGERFLAKLQQKFVRKFDEIWIPDVSTEPNISGKLGRNSLVPKNAKYIGLLSRFSTESPSNKPNGIDSEEFVLAIISGPEPMRSQFEQLMSSQFVETNQHVIIVGGTLTSTESIKNQNITYFPFLGMSELKWLITHAQNIISRSGYSTVMDLLALNKTAIFVPTPGQTEQEYLGEYLMKNGLFYSVSQRGFKGLETINDFTEWNQKRTANVIEKSSVLAEIIKSI